MKRKILITLSALLVSALIVNEVSYAWVAAAAGAAARRVRKNREARAEQADQNNKEDQGTRKAGESSDNSKAGSESPSESGYGASGTTCSD